MLYSNLGNWLEFFQKTEFDQVKSPRRQKTDNSFDKKNWLIWTFAASQIPATLIIIFSQILLTYGQGLVVEDAMNFLGFAATYFSIWLLIKILLNSFVYLWNNNWIWLCFSCQSTSLVSGIYTIYQELNGGFYIQNTTSKINPSTERCLTIFAWIMILFAQVYIFFSSLIILGLGFLSIFQTKKNHRHSSKFTIIENPSSSIIFSKNYLVNIPYLN